jgi:hypothetical protein
MLSGQGESNQLLSPAATDWLRDAAASAAAGVHSLRALSTFKAPQLTTLVADACARGRLPVGYLQSKSGR